MEYTKVFWKNHLAVYVTNSDLYVYGGGVVRSRGGSHTNKQFFLQSYNSTHPDTIYLEIVNKCILWVSWAWKPFYVPCFLFVGGTGFSLQTFPEFQRADLNRDGRGWRSRKQSRNSSWALGQDLVPLRDIQKIIISLSSSAELNPQQMRC